MTPQRLAAYSAWRIPIDNHSCAVSIDVPRGADLCHLHSPLVQHTGRHAALVAHAGHLCAAEQACVLDTALGSTGRGGVVRD